MLFEIGGLAFGTGYATLLYLEFDMGNINGLMQERRNSSALAMELHLSCTNPLTCSI